MAARTFETPNEKVISGAAALVMHSLFFAMLVFSINWKKPEPAAMVAELWSSLPPVTAPKVEPPPPPPQPKAEPKPPPPPPKVEPKPAPKAEPKPQPKADIELREKKEKERKAKALAALEKKKREEQALAEKKRREEQALAEKKKREEQQAKEAAEAKRLAQEQADAQRKLAQQQAAAQAREIDKYKQAIAARIRRFIVEPPNIQGNPVTELDIIMLPGGEVLDVRTRKPSGQSAWDNACERAIRRAQPLPLPSDPALMKDFRELGHLCRYKE